MRATIPVAALIDNKGTIGDLNLICAEVIDDIRIFYRGGQPPLGNSAHIHRAHAGRGRVQDQEARFGFLSQGLRCGQNRLAIGLTQGPLADDDQ